ncbi:Protein CBG23771, partial [Caenorhabditis briggsae]
TATHKCTLFLCALRVPRAPSSADLAIFGEEEEEEEDEGSIEKKVFDVQHFCKRHLQIKNDQIYTKFELFSLIDLIIDEFRKEPTLAEISPPVRIVGDIHGQHDDLRGRGLNLWLVGRWSKALSGTQVLGAHTHNGWATEDAPMNWVQGKDAGMGHIRGIWGTPPPQSISSPGLLALDEMN